MLIGTVTRTGAGAGTGKISCIVNKDFDFRVFCTGQSPSNIQYPYTTTFVVQTTCPTNYVRVPKNPAVGTNDDFCIAKYEMANDGSGNAISSETALRGRYCPGQWSGRRRRSYHQMPRAGCQGMI